MKKILSVLLVLAMVLSTGFNGTFKASASAAVQNDYAAGDIVTFGTYPQTKVTNSSLIAALNSSALSPENTVIYGGDKYQRVYFTQYTPFHPDFPATADNSYQDNNGYFINTVYWFKFEPVQWRVLSNTDGELFVIAETILDSRVYNQTLASVTWETSAMRSWLNNDFYNKVFTIDEKSKIKTSEVVNADNPWNSTEGGNNTNDKLFLLSYADTVNTDYGFSSSYETSDTARQAQGTDYSKSCGLFVNANAPYVGKSYWWLRSPGLSAVNAGYVYKSGAADSYTSVVVTHIGVRPACRIRLTPVIYSAGDILEYGSYPQSEVTDANLVTALNACTLSADNIAVYGGARYKKVLFEHYTSIEGGFTDNSGYTFQDNNGYFRNTVYWFKFEPVEWRVLSSKNGNLFVMAEKVLDSRAYHGDVPAVTWETSDTRAWLNNEFYNIAFTTEEKAMIKTTDVANPNNSTYGTPGGNNTNDRLFLLSFAEVQNAAYGFIASSSGDPARKAQGTEYSESCGLCVFTGMPSNGSCFWWLRSPGETAAKVGLVFDNGGFPNYGDMLNQACVGIRPVFKINLQSAVFIPSESSNCVIDYENNYIYGLTTGLDSLDGYVDTASGYVVSYTGTIGTGTRVNLSLDGLVIESFKTIIFGDVNGDGNITGIDAGIVVNVENYMTAWDPVSDAATIKAADVNGDGNVTGIDAGIVVDVENYMRTINQSTGLAS